MSHLLFDVWDLKKEAFLSGEFCIMNNGEVWRVEEGKLTEKYLEGKDVQVIRAIGRKDSYGNDIYECDVVSHTHLTYLGHGDVGEETQLVEIKSVHDLPFLGGGGDVSVEVVGSTLENPKLLEEIT